MFITAHYYNYHHPVSTLELFEEQLMFFFQIGVTNIVLNKLVEVVDVDQIHQQVAVVVFELELGLAVQHLLELGLVIRLRQHAGKEEKKNW